jgi:hypothetical protein
MADLHADLGLGLGMDEIDDPLPGSLVFGRIEPGQPGVIRPSARRRSSRCRPGLRRPWRARRSEPGASRSGSRRRPCTAPSARPRPVLELHVAQRVGREHRPRGAGAVGARPAPGTSARPLQPFARRAAQVLVADALRAGQERIVELHRIEVEIALDLLEPFHRVARRRLQPQHFEPALSCTCRKRLPASASECR